MPLIRHTLIVYWLEKFEREKIRFNSTKKIVSGFSSTKKIICCFSVESKGKATLFCFMFESFSYACFRLCSFLFGSQIFSINSEFFNCRWNFYWRNNHKFSADTIDLFCKLKVWFYPATSIFSVLYAIYISDNEMLMESFCTVFIFFFSVWFNGYISIQSSSCLLIHVFIGLVASR